MADSLTTSVVKTLFSEDIKKIRAFQLGANMIAPAHFYFLATKIHFFGTVQVQYSSKQESAGKYFSDDNILRFNFKKAEDLSQKANVIHEATHAILDMNKASVSNCDGETMSYIAQCQYARANTTDVGTRLEIRDHENKLIPERDDVFRYGWDIAGILLSGGTPSAADYRLLQDAVARHPYYSGDYSAQAQNDGI